jgi:hypothetical protein
MLCCECDLWSVSQCQSIYTTYSREEHGTVYRYWRRTLGGVVRRRALPAPPQCVRVRMAPASSVPQRLRAPRCAQRVNSRRRDDRDLGL